MGRAKNADENLVLHTGDLVKKAPREGGALKNYSEAAAFSAAAAAAAARSCAFFFGWAF